MLKMVCYKNAKIFMGTDRGKDCQAIIVIEKNFNLMDVVEVVIVSDPERFDRELERIKEKYSLDEVISNENPV